MLDGAVAVFDGVNGVEPQSETVWRQADKYDVPRICYINKMDRIGADFFMSVKTIEDKLGARALVIQLPIGSESAFAGIVDLVRMKAVIWKDESLGADYVVSDIPDDLKAQAAEYRAKLVEGAVDMDDAALEAYLGRRGAERGSAEEVHPQGTVESKFYPVILGSSFKTKACSHCSTPSASPAVADRRHRRQGTSVDGKIEMERECSDDEPFSGLALESWSIRSSAR